jgi:hypothetical protein
VGGVSGRAGAKAGGSNPSAHNDSFACRGGERHPGLLEGGTLRGVSSERGPRSVRLLSWVSSRGSRRADDSGCPEDAEEGNAVGMRDLCACTRRRHERSSHAPGDASFARSSDPCTSILTMLRGRKPSGVGRRQRHHGWESSRKREEPSLGSRSPDVARLAACHRFRKGDAWHVEKRKEIEVSVPARIVKSPGLVARTS